VILDQLAYRASQQPLVKKYSSSKNYLKCTMAPCSKSHGLMTYMDNYNIYNVGVLDL